MSDWTKRQKTPNFEFSEFPKFLKMFGLTSCGLNLIFFISHSVDIIFISFYLDMQ